jgi:hypothetical protein
MVRLAVYRSPSRAIGANQLAAELDIDPAEVETRLEALSQSLLQKGVQVKKIDRPAPLPPGYFCDFSDPPPVPTVRRAAGRSLEMSQPAGDR